MPCILFAFLFSESLLLSVKLLHRRSRVVCKNLSLSFSLYIGVLSECVGKVARAKAGGPERPLRTVLRVSRAMLFVSMCQTVCDRWGQKIACAKCSAHRWHMLSFFACNRALMLPCLGVDAGGGWGWHMLCIFVNKTCLVFVTYYSSSRTVSN